MKINCAIIDDEPLAVDLIKSYVERVPMLHLVDTYNSAIEALDQLNQDQIDLLFLDINMPELNGLDFAKLVPDNVRIVYTTAYSEYAIDSYRVNALDYLLKPISFDSFLESVNKAIRYLQIDGKHRLKEIKDEEDCLFVKSEYKLVRIKKSDILFIEGLKDYIKIYTTTNPRPILTLTSMLIMERELASTHFLRVHRSYIVNMLHVSHYERGKIIFDKHEIQVSENGKEQVKAYINQRLVSK